MAFDPNCPRNTLTRADDDSTEQVYAKMLGGTAFHGADGSVILERRLAGKRPQVVKYPDVDKAHAGMRDAINGKQSREQFAGKVDSIVQKGSINAPEFTTLEDVDPAVRAHLARVAVPGEGGSGVTNRVTYWLGREPRLNPDFYRTVEGNAQKFGPLGNDAVGMMTNNREFQNKFVARYHIVLDEVHKLLDEEDLATGFQKWREFGEVPADPSKLPKYQAAVDKLMEFKNVLYNQAKAIGIEVKDKLDNYFPHVHDWHRWTHPRDEDAMISTLMSRGTVADRNGANVFIEAKGYGWSRDRAIEHIATDRAISRTEAAALMFDKQNNSSFINVALDRTSGHLEADRINLPGYATHVDVAWGTAFTRDIRRISEVMNFGMHDARMKGVLGEIRGQSEKMASYLEQSFEIETGKHRLDFSKLGTVLSGLQDWQAAKLSLSFLPNLAQPLNAGIRGGYMNMFKALSEVPSAMINRSKTIDYLERRGEPAARHFAESWGTTRPARVMQSLLGEVEESGLSRLSDVIPSTYMKTKNVAINMLSYLFNVSELFVNRYVSSRVGEMVFEQEAEAFAGGTVKRQALAAARLKGLGFDAERVVGAMQKDPDAFAEMKMSASQVFNRQTQFHGDTMSLPLWASKGGEGAGGELMRLMLQFKTFPISQGRFIARELSAFQRGDTARSVRAIGALTTAFPILGYGLAKARSTLIGNTITTDMLERNLHDPTVFNLLAAGAASTMMVGSLGIMADTVGNVLQGNKFSAMGLFVPPTVDSLWDFADVGRSVVAGIATGNSKHFEHAARQGAREMGGIGSGLARVAGVGPNR